jgi:hypothetical protein
MTALASPTVRVKPKAQSAAERQAVYAYVTERDKTCRAPIIAASPTGNGALAFLMRLDCLGRSERHHAGNKIGTKRITDARHVVLLCKFHHRTWAPTHSRLILEWLADLEDRLERARHDIEEDAR